MSALHASQSRESTSGRQNYDTKSEIPVLIQLPDLCDPAPQTDATAAKSSSAAASTQAVTNAVAAAMVEPPALPDEPERDENQRTEPPIHTGSDERLAARASVPDDPTEPDTDAREQPVAKRSTDVDTSDNNRPDNAIPAKPTDRTAEIANDQPTDDEQTPPNHADQSEKPAARRRSVRFEVETLPWWRLAKAGMAISLLVAMFIVAYLMIAGGGSRREVVEQAGDESTIDEQPAAPSDIRLEPEEDPPLDFEIVPKLPAQPVAKTTPEKQSADTQTTGDHGRSRHQHSGSQDDKSKTAFASPHEGQSADKQRNEPADRVAENGTFGPAAEHSFVQPPAANDQPSNAGSYQPSIYENESFADHNAPAAANDTVNFRPQPSRYPTTDPSTFEYPEHYHLIFRPADANSTTMRRGGDWSDAANDHSGRSNTAHLPPGAETAPLR